MKEIPEVSPKELEAVNKLVSDKKKVDEEIRKLTKDVEELTRYVLITCFHESWIFYLQLLFLYELLYEMAIDKFPYLLEKFVKLSLH